MEINFKIAATEDEQLLNYLTPKRRKCGII